MKREKYGEVSLESSGMTQSKTWYKRVLGVLEDNIKHNSDFSFVSSGLSKLWEP